MSKSYDSDYFQRWYRDPRTRVTSDRALERKVHLALSAAAYMLGRRARTVLALGGGVHAGAAPANGARHLLRGGTVVRRAPPAPARYPLHRGRIERVRRGDFRRESQRPPRQLRDASQPQAQRAVRSDRLRRCATVRVEGAPRTRTAGDPALVRRSRLHRGLRARGRHGRRHGRVELPIGGDLSARVQGSGVDPLRPVLLHRRQEDQRRQRSRGVLMIGRLELVRQDLTVAARSLARSPLFVVTTVLSLALGIGASAAAFAVLDAVRFRALPFPHGERLVTIQESPIAAGAPAGACLATCDPSYETFAQVL